MRLLKPTRLKLVLAIAVAAVSSAVAYWHLSPLAEGDIFQTAEVFMALILFF